MKLRFISTLIVNAMLFAIVSCASPPLVTTPVPVCTDATNNASTTPATSAQAEPEPVLTTLPVYNQPDITAVAPIWQLCTWELYRLFTEPVVPLVGQPTIIWSYIYIEDFPTTDVNTELLVNGVVVDRQVVTVNFDEAWPFYFTYIPDKPGVFDLSVRAIFAVNAIFATMPGGEINYNEIAVKMVVLP
jgi:hypothetical protein